MAHRSMNFADVTVVVDSTSLYHPEDGRGGVETVAVTAGVKADPTAALVAESSVCALRSISWGRSSAGSVMTVYHGDGEVAFSTSHDASYISASPDMGPDGLELLGQWYVGFSVGATVACALLFDIEPA